LRRPLYKLTQRKELFNPGLRRFAFSVEGFYERVNALAYLRL